MERQTRRLTPQEEEEIDILLLAGLECISISNEEKEDFFIHKIDAIIHSFREEPRTQEERSQEDICMQLGAVYGEQMCFVYDWEWVYLDIPTQKTGIAVVNPQRNRAFFPLEAIFHWTQIGLHNRCLALWKTLDEPIIDTTFQLLD